MRRESETRDAADRLFEDKLVGEDEALAAALSESAKAGLPLAAVSAVQGKQLYLTPPTGRTHANDHSSFGV